ncbi:RNA 2'-phosphotransferase [Lysobacter sp. CCNWLW3]|uniref:RNA 2'-phosphotransferase n=1 Tax=unclassified Lysobacter TaxID=2635362 RepID=UPI002FD64072
MSPELTRISKLLGLVLRHRPEAIGLRLDGEGWADIGELIACAGAHGRRISREQLQAVVRDNDKRRYAISDDGQRIRARQGHSIEVDLGLEAREPPALLYHGTATRHADSIREQGLLKRSRQHVHLSADEGTARAVGARHGPPLVLRIRAADLHARGCVFHLSENGVWLTDAVAPEFIDWPGEAAAS